ncbi:MAG: prohibitin family protein [Nitrospirota bacterium]|nr:prohibitin family protein [Nitrospirota bacterium]
MSETPTYKPVQLGVPGGAGGFLAIAAVLALFLLYNTAFVTVGAGERGVVFSKFGGVKEHVLGEGLHFKMPFFEEVITVDVKVQKVQPRAEASSRDLQTVTSTVAINFHVDPLKVAVVYQEVGLEFGSRIIDPAVQEAVKAVTAQYSAEELITQRSKVRDDIKEILRKRLAGFHILMDEFSIVAFDFSREFNAAIEAKQTAEQNALKASRDLDRIRVEAEQKVTQAQAEADAQRLQAQTITADILSLRAIEKWDGHLPQVVGGDGAVPFLNIGDLKSSKR